MNVIKEGDKENMVPIQNIRKHPYWHSRATKKVVENYQPIRNSKLTQHKKIYTKVSVPRSPTLRHDLEKSISYIMSQEAKKRKSKKRNKYINR